MKENLIVFTPKKKNTRHSLCKNFNRTRVVLSIKYKVVPSNSPLYSRWIVTFFEIFLFRSDSLTSFDVGWVMIIHTHVCMHMKMQQTPVTYPRTGRYTSSKWIIITSVTCQVNKLFISSVVGNNNCGTRAVRNVVFCWCGSRLVRVYAIPFL